MNKFFQLVCCVNRDHVFQTYARGICVARLRAHARGWASTSMDSPTAVDICPECVKKHPRYAMNRPFKRSIFAAIHAGNIHQKALDNKA